MKLLAQSNPPEGVAHLRSHYIIGGGNTIVHHAVRCAPGFTTVVVKLNPSDQFLDIEKQKSLQLFVFNIINGGEGGIRTLEELTPLLP